MKECLVIVLVLSLTGTVLGQSTSTGSAFDEPRVDSSRTSGQRDLFAQSNSADSDSKGFSGQQGPMLLDLDAKLIEQMISHGLEATIVSEDMVNGIVLRFGAAGTAKPAITDVPRTLKPSLDSGNGVLRFSLDREGIERLKTEGLQYKYSQAELAKYKTVVLSYEGNDASAVSLINQRSTTLDSDRDFSSPSRTTSNRIDSPRRSNQLDSVGPSSTALGRQPTRDDQDGSRFNRSLFNATDRETLSPNRRDTQVQPRRGLDLFTGQPSSQTEFGAANDMTDEERFLARKRELERKQTEDRRRQLDLDHGYQRQDARTSYTQDERNDRVHQFELTDSDIDQVAQSVQQIRDTQDRRAAEVELLRRKKEASDREARLANAERLRLERQLRDRNTLDDSPVVQRRTLAHDDLYSSYDRRHLTPTADRFARVDSHDLHHDHRDHRDRATNIGRSPNTYLTGDSSTRLSDADLRDSRLRDERWRNEQLRTEQIALENENLQLRRQQAEADRLQRQRETLVPTNFGTNQLAQTNDRPLQLRDFGASIPGTKRPGDNRVASLNTQRTTNVGNTVYSSSSVDHILKQYNGNNFGEVASRVQQEVAATAALKVRTDKFNGFLLFLFITSFALNLYLAWLAQTFYGRYGELADELRETFTATT